jgi:hypothetical protein
MDALDKARIIKVQQALQPGLGVILTRWHLLAFKSSNLLNLQPDLEVG